MSMSKTTAEFHHDPTGAGATGAAAAAAGCRTPVRLPSITFNTMVKKILFTQLSLLVLPARIK